MYFHDSTYSKYIKLLCMEDTEIAVSYTPCRPDWQGTDRSRRKRSVTVGTDAISQKTHCWKTQTECRHLWSRVNDTSAPTTSPLPDVHKAVQYSTMKELLLQTQRKTALIPKEVNRRKGKKKRKGKRAYITYKMKQLLSMYNSTLNVHASCAIHV